ncbi:MAG TPA: TolC family outer membrane protein [Stellaceae bacterium]|nr:TolC family outer membrane protein [Stellaceae bacterium]
MARGATGLRLIAAALTAGAAAPAFADTLADALADAYRGNATILAERYRQRQTDEALPEALAGWRPTVNLQGNVARAHQFFGLSFPGSRPISDITPRTASATLDQPIWHGGGIEAGIDQARASIAAGQAQLSATEQDQLLVAATAYLDAFRDKRVVELSENLVEVLTLNQHDVQVTYNAGAATETDTSQAVARLSGAVAGRLGAKAQLGTSLARFRTAVGRDAVGDLSPPTQIGQVPATEDEAARAAADRSPSVEAARHSLEAAQHAVDQARAALLPQVDGVATLQHDDDYLIRGVKLNQAEIGVQATVPLYVGPAYAKVRAAKEGVSQAEKQVLEAEREARETVATAWNALQAARAQQEQYRSQIKANEVALSDTAKEVTAGTRTRLDVLNAQQELFSSRVNLVSAEHDTLLAGFRLEAAIGTFTPAALGLATPDYDPTEHLKAVEDKWWGTSPPD